MNSSGQWQLAYNTPQGNAQFSLAVPDGMMPSLVAKPKSPSDRADIMQVSVDKETRTHTYVLRLSLNPNEGVHDVDILAKLCQESSCPLTGIPVHIVLDTTRPDLSLVGTVEIRDGKACFVIKSEPGARISQVRDSSQIYFGVTRPDGTAEVCVRPQGVGQQSAAFNSTDAAGNVTGGGVEYKYEPQKGVQILSARYDVSAKKLVIKGVWTDPQKNLIPGFTDITCNGDVIPGVRVGVGGKVTKFSDGEFEAVCTGPIGLGGDIYNAGGKMAFHDYNNNYFEVDFKGDSPDIPTPVKLAVLALATTLATLSLTKAANALGKYLGNNKVEGQKRRHANLQQALNVLYSDPAAVGPYISALYFADKPLVKAEQQFAEKYHAHKDIIAKLEGNPRGLDIEGYRNNLNLLCGLVEKSVYGKTMFGKIFNGYLSGILSIFREYENEISGHGQREISQDVWAELSSWIMLVNTIGSQSAFDRYKTGEGMWEQVDAYKKILNLVTEAYNSSGRGVTKVRFMSVPDEVANRVCTILHACGKSSIVDQLRK
jgi:hypothetical protein